MLYPGEISLGFERISEPVNIIDIPLPNVSFSYNQFEHSASSEIYLETFTWT